MENKQILYATTILLLTGLYECSMFISNYKIQAIWFIFTILIQLFLFGKLLLLLFRKDGKDE
jgi:hypothetical protein